MVTPASYDNIKQKWYPEVRHHNRDAQIILVGTKSDLRDDKAYVEQMAQKNLKPITKEQGEELRKEIKAERYMECSAIKNIGVKQVFDEAIRLELFKKPKKRVYNCSLL